ncbi:MAG: alpha/beta hydrolase-fold protein [Bacteroidota bacterium]|nr:alpha/beta hydrolase-fold protein [Bacteroidota bacterium]
MNREYIKWHSSTLQRDMEMLVFGDSGARIIFFPTRKARFFDYENWGVMDALREKVEKRLIQVYCVDSIDCESFYNTLASPAERIMRHIQYEQYILNEVIPFSLSKNSNSFLISAGCSLGAYHAINIALRHPKFFGKVVGMSGRYDLTQAMGVFKDLFQGYVDENVYFNMPNRYMQGLNDEKYLNEIRRLSITIAVGEEDAFLNDNKFFHKVLNDKLITNNLAIWSKESHNPIEWRQMVQLYF